MPKGIRKTTQREIAARKKSSKISYSDLKPSKKNPRDPKADEAGLNSRKKK